jgi:hypothetical protein
MAINWSYYCGKVTFNEKGNIIFNLDKWFADQGFALDKNIMDKIMKIVEKCSEMNETTKTAIVENYYTNCIYIFLFEVLVIFGCTTNTITQNRTPNKAIQGRYGDLCII